jgi:hypothetical protein
MAPLPLRKAILNRCLYPQMTSHPDALEDGPRLGLCCPRFDIRRSASEAPKICATIFSVEEIQRILASAPQSYFTLYWTAAETGMRAGELCGLRISDFDLDRRLVRVNRSVWRGKSQSTKSEHRDQCFALSSLLCAHLADFFSQWKPNESGWLFATRLGTPWDLVKRKLYPLLDSLGIERGGFACFPACEHHVDGSSRRAFKATSAAQRRIVNAGCLYACGK